MRYRFSLKQKVDIILNTVLKTISDVKNLSAEVVKLREENTLLNKKIDSLEKRIDNLESQSKQNWLVFYGVQEEGDEDSDILELNIIQIMKNKLEFEVPTDALEKTFRLGKGVNQYRPVAVKFTNFKYKKVIMRKATNFNNSDYAVSHFYTPKENQQRAEFRKYLKNAKESGHKVYIQHNKMYLDKKAYTLEECEQYFGSSILSETKQNSSSSKRDPHLSDPNNFRSLRSHKKK